tara:strand:+ start:1042 stop:1410 length:369 start_codon:yes stop_codon:yes gene_type:complete
MDYSSVISILVPDSKFSINQNDYSTLIWDDSNTTSKPTEEEIINTINEIISEYSYDVLRYERNKLLESSDKYALSDFPHNSDEKKQEWLTYRQQLRDITTSQTPSVDSSGNLINITWPNKPQ